MAVYIYLDGVNVGGVVLQGERRDSVIHAQRTSAVTERPFCFSSIELTGMASTFVYHAYHG